MMHGARGARVPAREDQEPGRVAEHRQDRRLPVVPRAGHARDAHDPGGARRLPHIRRGVAAAAASGQAQAFMTRDITRLDTERALALFGDWTDRIAAGELPFARPDASAGARAQPRHHEWDWISPTAYLHDEMRPTGATRASMRTARSTARPRTAPTSCPCSIPRAHRRARCCIRCAIRDAVDEEQPDGAVSALGRRADLGQQDAQPQPDDGRARARVVHVAHAAQRES